MSQSPLSGLRHAVPLSPPPPPVHTGRQDHRQRAGPSRDCPHSHLHQTLVV